MLIDSYRKVTNSIKSDDIKTIMQGIPTSKSGTVKDWFANKEGKNMLCLSVDVNDDGSIASAWMPPARIVDSVRGTFATLEGSRIDLKGKVLASNENYILFSQPWGEGCEKVYGYRVF